MYERTHVSQLGGKLCNGVSVYRCSHLRHACGSHLYLHRYIILLLVFYPLVNAAIVIEFLAGWRFSPSRTLMAWIEFNFDFLSPTGINVLSVIVIAKHVPVWLGFIMSRYNVILSYEILFHGNRRLIPQISWSINQLRNDSSLLVARFKKKYLLINQSFL